MRKNASRIISLVLSLVIVIGAIPCGIVFGSAADGPKVLTDQNNPPSGYNANDNSNPYGLDSEHALTMKSHEVFLYKTTKKSSNLSGENGIYVKDYSLPSFKDYGDQYKYADQDLDAVVLGRSTTRGSQGSNALVNLSNSSSPTYYTRLAAIDPTGSGRDDYVAQLFVLRDSDKNNTSQIRVINAKTGKISAAKNIQSVDWITSDGIPQATLNNYFSIAGGDFDGDGKDEIAVYSSGDADNRVEFYEVTPSESGEPSLTYYGKIVGSTDSGLNNDTHGTNKLDKITGSLAAADIDKDGIDELIVCTGTNYRDAIKGHKDETMNAQNSVSKVTVWEFNGSQTVLKNSWNTATLTDNSNHVDTYDAIQSGAVSVGDVDGDGSNEIVVTGYLAQISLDHNDNERTGLYSYSDSLFAICTIDPDSNGESVAVYSVKQTALINGGLHMDYSASDCIYPLLINQCVAVNGPNAPELVFVGGNFYTLTGSPKCVYSLKLYEDESSLNRRYVETIAVGNFAQSNEAREQVMFTIGWKSDSDDKYTYKLALMGNDNNKYFSIFNKAGDEDHFQDDSTMGLYNEDGELWKDEPGPNYVPCAVDVDNDGLCLGYVGKSYAYSDPEVIAVLQAAPYFGELGFEGETEYSVSTTYGRTKSSGNSVSFGVGLSFEWETGAFPKYKGGFDIGYAMDWEESFEESWETTYTDSFTAGAEDTVIVQRTPVQVYCYRVWDNENNTWLKQNGTDALIYLSVPMKPTYYTLSVPEYNSFVDEYGKALDEGKTNTLKKIDSTVMPLNADGNPQNYYHALGDAGYGAEEVSKSSYALSHNGSSISSSKDTSTSTTVGESWGHGFSFHTQHGIGFTENFTAQVYADLDYSHNTGSYETRGDSTSCSGSVSGLSKSDDLPENVINQYNFNWQFIMWKRQLDTKTANYYVPVLGYITTNVAAPAAPVDDLVGSFDNGKITLSWTNPNANNSNAIRKNKGFNVYIERDGEYVKLNSSLVTSTKYEYTLGSSEMIASFLVRPVNSETGKEGSDSNIVTMLNVEKPKTISTIEKSSSGNGTETFIVRYTDGSFDTIRVNDTTTAYDIAKNECGYTGSKSDWDNKVSENGSAYEALKSIGYNKSSETFLRAAGCEGGHTYTDFTVEPTCMGKGITLSVCSVCGKISVTEISPKGHEYNNPVTVAATCLDAGYTVHSCKNCDYTYMDNVVSALGHDYKTTVTAPTCTAAGYTTYKCSRCNESHIDNITKATGHSYNNTGAVVETAATCSAKGYTTYKCDNCDETHVVYKEGFAAHNFETKEITRKYTADGDNCKYNSYVVKTCTECGYQKITEETGSAEHSYKLIEEKAPTCTEKGLKVYKCVNCGASYSVEEKCLSHTYTDKVTAPTCVDKGYTTHTCSCGDTYVDNYVNAIGHSFIDKVTAPTCTADGYTTHICENCGYVKVDTEVEATGHIPGGWICDDASAGHYVKNCTCCGIQLEEKTVEINVGGEGGSSVASGSTVEIRYNEATAFNVSEIFDGAKVTYTSSDTSVVTVDENGNISAVGSGEATIAAYVDGIDTPVTVNVKVKMTWWQKLLKALSSLLPFNLIYVIFDIRF